MFNHLRTLKCQKKGPDLIVHPKKILGVTGTQYELEKIIQLLENGFNISHIIGGEW
jgi:hypothetical protein